MSIYLGGKYLNFQQSSFLWLRSPLATGMASGICYLAAEYLAINPVKAAVFGAVFSVLDTVITAVVKNLFKDKTAYDGMHKMNYYRVSIISASALGAYLINPLLGYTLKNTSALLLTGTLTLTSGMIPIAVTIAIFAYKKALIAADSCGNQCIALGNRLNSSSRSTQDIRSP